MTAKRKSANSFPKNIGHLTQIHRAVLKKAFKAAFTGDETGKIKLKTKEETDAILARLQDAEYSVSSVKKERADVLRRRRLQPPPCSRTPPESSDFRLSAL